MNTLPNEVINYLELLLANKREYFKKTYLNNANSIFKLLLVNPPKREDITDSISMILEGDTLIIYSDFTSTEKHFKIERV